MQWPARRGTPDTADAGRQEQIFAVRADYFKDTLITKAHHGHGGKQAFHPHKKAARI